ncbi:MAG: DUF3179 domain-containing protein [Mycolicibacterium sp.]|uniref:DUF3179 domain-containing protein n=1 Tax=Mycolicibacterium sp. TaxID=2320850 RepID=UPI003D0A91CB
MPTEQTPTRRQILIGAGVVVGAGALGATGLLTWRAGNRTGGQAKADGDELDALADTAISGGPGKDGIPPIDRPRFVPAGDVDYLDDEAPVFGLNHRGEMRAYPQSILVWHEIVNDTVAGAPLSLTYCPLTGTAIGFASPAGEAWTFGTTGKLVNSNLLMYDRQTDSQWPQILGTAISGPRKGTVLTPVPLVWTTFRAWRAAHPDSPVLSTDTGALRRYGSDPYGSYTPPSGYYVEPGTYFPIRHTDDRLGDKDVVIGIRFGPDRIAIQKDRIFEDRQIQVDVGGVTWRAQWNDELATATVVNAGTGEVADFLEAMWFAWFAFYPQTRLLA